MSCFRRVISGWIHLIERCSIALCTAKFELVFICAHWVKTATGLVKSMVRMSFNNPALSKPRSNFFPYVFILQFNLLSLDRRTKKDCELFVYVCVRGYDWEFRAKVPSILQAAVPAHLWLRSLLIPRPLCIMSPSYYSSLCPSVSPVTSSSLSHFVSCHSSRSFPSADFQFLSDHPAVPVAKRRLAVLWIWQHLSARLLFECCSMEPRFRSLR